MLKKILFQNYKNVCAQTVRRQVLEKNRLANSKLLLFNSRKSVLNTVVSETEH